MEKTDYKEGVCWVYAVAMVVAQRSALRKAVLVWRLIYNQAVGAETCTVIVRALLPLAHPLAVAQP